MKANELMIGDWVLDGNVYAQVTSITCDGNIETTHNEHSNIELIEHIPLTTEILEKNGFNNVIWQGEASWSYHENEVYVCISGRSGGIKHFGYNGWDSKIAISSVHELQHALKLCWVEKTIEL